jgi:DNA polymerase-3 subunit delta'
MASPQSKLPWLAEPMARAREAFERGRLGHAILVQARAGLGSEVLARWLAALVLCDSKEGQPCGVCPSCTLLAASTHPDLLVIERQEDATQIKVEQVRELGETLALKSLRGGYKAALIPEADALNANAANALLKTLEEPQARTLLVLCTTRSSRLPPTIVSRCQRLVIPLPRRDAALEWLRQVKPLEHWPRILDYAAGAPLLAVELESGAFLALDREMVQAMDQLQARRLDLPGTAERWAKTGLEPRLIWLDAWIATRVREGLLPAGHLPSPRRIRNIRGLYALLDRVRALKLELTTPINAQLATEELLLQAETVLAA